MKSALFGSSFLYRPLEGQASTNQGVVIPLSKVPSLLHSLPSQLPRYQHLTSPQFCKLLPSLCQHECPLSSQSAYVSSAGSPEGQLEVKHDSPLRYDSFQLPLAAFWLYLPRTLTACLIASATSLLSGPIHLTTQLGLVQAVCPFPLRQRPSQP